MRSKNILPSILLSIIVLNTVSYDAYSNIANYDMCVSQKDELYELCKCNNNNGERRGSLTNLPNSCPNLQLLENNLDNNNEQEKVNTNKKYKRNELHTKLVIYKPMKPNNKLVKFNNISHHNTLGQLSIIYPEISNEFLINLLYDVKTNSIQQLLNKEKNFQDSISLNYIYYLLWNKYNNRRDNIPELEEENEILTNNTEKLQNITLKLIDYKKTFELNQNIENNILSYILNNIKNKKSNTSNKLVLQKLVTRFKKQARNNLNRILFLKTQYEKICGLEGILYTYSTLDSLLSELPDENYKNDISCDNIDNMSYGDIIHNVNQLHLKISNNINAFYKDCLFGNNLPISKDLTEINNILHAIENSNNNENIINNLNDIDKILLKIENSSTEQYMKYIASDLKTIKKKLLEIANNIDFSNINDYLQPIKLRLSKLNNYKLITPVNNDILSWCEDKYEDWAEPHSEYEELVKDRFKRGINSNNITQETFYNIVNMFYRIATMNLQLENYDRTIKLLYNTSNVSTKLIYNNQQRIFVY